MLIIINGRDPDGSGSMYSMYNITYSAAIRDVSGRFGALNSYATACVTVIICHYIKLLSWLRRLY